QLLVPGGGQFSHAAVSIAVQAQQGPIVPFMPVERGESENADYLPWGVELEPVNRLFQGWRRRFYHLDALRIAAVEVPATGDPVLHPSGHNLPQALLYLNVNHDL